MHARTSIALFSLCMGFMIALASGAAHAAKCRLVNVDSVHFKDGGKRGWYLYVGGMKRFTNMTVGLDHAALARGTLTLEVLGCTANFIAIPVPSPYTVELPLKQIPGVRAVRIVGANGETRHKLPGR